MGANVFIGVVVTSGAGTVSSTSTFTELDILARVHFGATTIQMILLFVCHRITRAA
jgi:hypothetical protein